VFAELLPGNALIKSITIFSTLKTEEYVGSIAFMLVSCSAYSTLDMELILLRVSWEASLYRGSLLGNSSVARHPAPT
jgi:hypothetical protein